MNANDSENVVEVGFKGYCAIVRRFYMYLKRKIGRFLQEWFEDASKKPLIINCIPSRISVHFCYATG